MANNGTTTRFRVDISELVNGMQKAKRQIALANAEFKAATSGMDSWSKSADGITAKLRQLDTTLNGQKTILSNLEQQYDLVCQQMGADSREAENLRIKIENQKAAIGNTEKQIRNYTSSLETIENEAGYTQTALEDLEETISDQEKELKDMKRAYANAIIEFGRGSEEANELEEQINELSGELEENQARLRDATGAVDDLDDSLEETGNAAEASSSGFSVMQYALANLIADGIKKATEALVGFISESVKVGQEFEASMSEVSAISGATGKDFELLEKTAKEYGATTTFSASEAAQALKYMALAGWDANKSSSALGGVLDLAAASGMDLAQASDMVTDYMSAFGMEANKSTYFADMLAYSQSNANTSAEQLGEAYKNCAANLNAAGQDVETVTALLSMMANQGFKGSESGTALTAIMRDMTAKMLSLSDETEIANYSIDGFTSATGDMNDLLGKNSILIGKTLVPVSDLNGNYRDMTDILKDVEKATNGMGDAERAAALSSTFTADSTKGLNLLLNAGISTAEEFEEALRGSGETAGKMADIMNDNLAGDVKQAQSALEDLQITAYDELQPALREIVQYVSGTIIPTLKNDVIPVVRDEIIPAIKEFIGWIVDNKDTVIPAIVGIGTAFLVWDVAHMILGVVTAIKALWLATEGATVAMRIFNLVGKANVFILIASLIAALVAAFITLWNTNEEFRQFWIDMWNQISSKISEVWNEYISPILSWIGEKFTELFNYLSELWTTTLQPMFISLGEKFKEIWESYLQPALAAIGEFFASTFAFLSDLWTNTLMPVFIAIGNKFREIWKSYLYPALVAIANFFKSTFNVLKNIWETVLKPVFQAIGTIFKFIWDTVLKVVLIAMAALFATVWKSIEALWNNVLKPVFNVLGTFFKFIWDTFVKPILKQYVENFKTVFNFIKTVWNNILKPVFKAIGDKFKEVWENYLKPTIEAIKTAFKTMSEVIGGIWNNLWNNIIKPVINSILGGVEGFANGIVKGLNVVIGALNNLSFEIPDWVPEFGGKEFGFNIKKMAEISLPRLAKGGLIDKATIAMIGEAGREAVIPLDRNTGWMDEIAARISDRGGIAGSNAQTIYNSYSYEYNQTNNSPKALNRLEIYRQTKNQFNYATGGGV